MNKHLLEMFRLSLPLGILALGFFGFTALANQRQQPEPLPIEEHFPLVETVPVEVSSDGLDIHIDGMVVPHREINLSAEVAGRITRKFPECRAGHYVTAGTPLLEIDSRSYQLAVDRLQEEVAQANNSLQELEVELKNHDSMLQLLQEDLSLKQREFKRVSQLYSQGIINESELDSARAVELTARNAFVSMENQRRMSDVSRNRLTNLRELAATRLKEAELDLEKAKVVAPIDGVIVKETIEEGNYVASGASLITIEDTAAAEVRTSLRMDEINWVWQQNTPDYPPTTEQTSQARSAQLDYQLPQVPVTISYDLGGREYRWKGYLWRYDGIGLNEKTRTVPVRILVPQPREVLTGEHDYILRGPKALVRGMFVKITLHTTPDVQFLKVPERAVQPGNILWTVRDQKLHQIPLRNANYQDGGVIVANSGQGLRPDDQVVITPLLLASEGMQVEVKTAAQTAAQTVTRAAVMAGRQSGHQ